MTGAWAREADATEVHVSVGLDWAAHWLASSLTAGRGDHRQFALGRASAIIRSERKRFDPEKKVERCRDWPGHISDEELIWSALRMLVLVTPTTTTEIKAYYMRQSEAALRTLHKRGRS